MQMPPWAVPVTPCEILTKSFPKMDRLLCISKVVKVSMFWRQSFGRHSSVWGCLGLSFHRHPVFWTVSLLTSGRRARLALPEWTFFFDDGFLWPQQPRLVDWLKQTLVISRLNGFRGFKRLDGLENSQLAHGSRGHLPLQVPGTLTVETPFSQLI